MNATQTWLPFPPSRSPCVVGLGLVPKAPTQAPDLPEHLRRLAEELLAGQDLVARLTPELFTELFSLWRGRNPGARVAVTPYGTFGRALAASLPGDSLPDFYDNMPGEGAKPRSSLRSGDHEAVIIASTLHRDGISAELFLQGVSMPRVLDLACLCFEALIQDYSLESAGALLDQAARLRRPGDRWALAYAAPESRRLADYMRRLDADGLIEDICDMSPCRFQWMRHEPLWNEPDGKATHVLAIGSDTDAQRHMTRMIGWRMDAKADIVLPHLAAGSVPRERFADASPSLAYAFPFTGTNRFLLPFMRYSELLRRKPVDYFEPHKIPRCLAGHWRSGRGVPVELSSLTLRARACTLDYFEFFVAHQIHDLTAVADLTWLKTIVLLRDPRDVLNSKVRRDDIPKGPTYDEACLTAMEGMPHFVWPEHTVAWPRLDNMLDIFLVVADNPANMRFIRFEDLHRDPRGTFRDALDWLGWTPDPFVSLTEQDHDEAIELGSFKHQTKGRHDRGSELSGVFPGTSCRKGIVGDWRNNWTERLKDRFKELAGDRLIRLGYETDNDW